MVLVTLPSNTQKMLLKILVTPEAAGIPLYVDSPTRWT